MKKTVIKCGLYFWTGKAYSYEYPNAKTYTNWPSIKEIQKATAVVVSKEPKLNAVSVYHDYGLTTQDRYQFVDAVRNEGVIVSEYWGILS